MSSITAGPPADRAASPVPGAGRPHPDADAVHEERQCSRCRLHFDIDVRDAPDAWWLCGPCHGALFGTAR